MATIDKTISFGKARIQLNGFDALFKRLNRVGGDAMEAAKEVFSDGTKRVYAKSQSRVPVDEGNLKASGRISKPRVNRKTRVVTASVIYGGAKLKRLAPDDNPLYAVAVHENQGGRGFKFLENPMNSEKSAVMGDLHRRIAAKVGRGR